jgi:hypothetical protein
LSRGIFFGSVKRGQLDSGWFSHKKDGFFAKTGKKCLSKQFFGVYYWQIGIKWTFHSPPTGGEA